ncbi:MAG: YihY/virulence factor BrkB family protein [Dehalococcoidia bacterium]|nr:YihY/virulence factor BrkB family protein [Dehalococcoidia bacterium]
MKSWSDRMVAFLRQAFVVVRLTTRRFSDQEGMHLAAGIAYYVLLSIFPAAVVMVSVFSFFYEPHEITSWLVDRFGEETSIQADFLERTVQSAASVRGPAGILGLVGLILSSTLAFAAIMRSINRAWGLIGTGTRTFMRRKMWEFALLAGTLLLLLLFYAGNTLLDLLRDIPFPGTDYHLATDSVWWAIFLGFFSFVAMTGILMLLYIYVPTTEVRWRHVLLPSVLVAAAFRVANELLGLFVGSLGYYDAVYGSVASVVVLLVWVYVSANILIVGAAMSAVLSDTSHQPSAPESTP